MGNISLQLKMHYMEAQKEYVACPLCSVSADKIIARHGYPDNLPLTNVICRTCGLIRIDPRMDRTGYERFYRDDFFDYLNPYSRPAYIEEIERTTDPLFETPTKRSLIPYMIPYVKPGGRVLDVGAGFGQVLYLLQQAKNIEPFGIEPDPYSREVAKNKIGIELDSRTVEDFLSAPQNPYDFIVLNQTFEHLLSPLQTLKQLVDVLAPEGVIYIGVPNAYNPQMPINLFYQLAHTYNYTPHTIKLFAERAGLKVISVRDPMRHPLEVLLAHKDASYPEEDAGRMKQGSIWRDTLRRLRRKKILNIVRGSGKRILSTFIGERGKERIRTVIDRWVHYQY